jgi:hypothetical protein
MRNLAVNTVVEALERAIHSSRTSP